jgi:hypothetical protein
MAFIFVFDSDKKAKTKMFVTVDGVNRDVKEFFSLPIPKAVWEKIKS